MRKIILLTFALAGLLTISSCKKDKTPPQPTADFSYTGGGCTAPCAVLFDNKSKDATSFSWDFGDGTTSTETNPTKSYNVGGTYTVKLTAKGKGGTASTSKQLLIQKSTQSQLPTANFTFSGGNCTAPCNVNFSNTSSNATTYEWDFGDGSTSTLENPSHTYTTGGVFSVKLKATNAAGDNQITKTVTITEPSTDLELTIRDELGNLVSGVSVKLYASETDWTNKTNQVGQTLISNASGKVTFTNLSNIKYYWFAEKDCKNNIHGAVTTVNPLTANVTTALNISLIPTGKLKFVNTSSNPYRVFINGTPYIDMNGGTTKEVPYSQTGNYSIRVLQLSGYVLYPTDQTYTGTLGCGQTMTTTFP